MTIENKIINLNNLIDEIALTIYDSFKIGEGKILKYNCDEILDGDYSEIIAHKGIYGFSLNNESDNAIVYIGKTENVERLRHHLTGKNKIKDTPTKSNNKHEEIKNAIKMGFVVKVHCFKSSIFNNFKKPSLSAIESALIIIAQKEWKNGRIKIKHWNERNG